MNNKEYHSKYNQYISYNIMRDTFMGLSSTDIPEEAQQLVKLMFKDAFGMVEFQGDIISSIKRNRIAHCLD